ncbi:hypothetical protein I5I01_gp59 [Mycobacterium phage MooMoo]|uniref:Uncharacterized protein n=1 Tax=Mycobacterium phage MooMoo TaxID=2108127 RepID=A0A2P1JR94_9CAUD|nr:hypothetical protein I5I01_gp59 [Mycobacterium phage MooMoo]AVO21664.1 hypothetical protein SEA_MOOMOO_59 [Mycobacterium phage MooMoo]
MNRPSYDDLARENALLKGELVEARQALKFVRTQYSIASAQWVEIAKSPEAMAQLAEVRS